LHSVAIDGKLNYTMPQNKEIKTLDIGSYFGSTEKAVHTIANNSENEVVLYIRTNGKVNIK